MDTSFTDFANVWTPVALAGELGHEKPLAVQVAGVRLAPFRGAGGQPAALLDRCIHRGVALSLGRVEAQCLECPFHGWLYAADGSVTNVPWNPNQDKAIVESSQPPRVPDARDEKSVRTDAPVLRFRKLYFERLAR